MSKQSKVVWFAGQVHKFELSDKCSKVATGLLLDTCPLTSCAFLRVRVSKSWHSRASSKFGAQKLVQHCTALYSSSHGFHKASSKLKIDPLQGPSWLLLTSFDAAQL